MSMEGSSDLTFQHAGTWSAAAWLPRCLCYITVFCYLCLIVLQFLQRKIWDALKMCCYSLFYYILQVCRSNCI